MSAASPAPGARGASPAPGARDSSSASGSGDDASRDGPAILVFGSLNADLLFRMERAPVPGQTLLAHALEVQPGGKGANQAAAAARDGARVRMVGAVGGDALAAVALDGLRAAGVDVAGVRRLAGVATGCASICTDAEGRNQIAVALGANARARAEWVEDALLVPGTAVLLQMEADPGEVVSLMRRARARGCRVVLNLAPAVPLPAEALRLPELLVVNEDEAETLGAALGCAGEAAALHAALGTGVVRTLGAAGAEAVTAAGAVRVAAPRVRAVDSTAAGDCFVGVLAAALGRGMGLERAMRRACTAAALACTVAGSQGSLPDAAAIDAAEGRGDGSGALPP